MQNVMLKVLFTVRARRHAYALICTKKWKCKKMYVGMACQKSMQTR